MVRIPKWHKLRYLWPTNKCHGTLSGSNFAISNAVNSQTNPAIAYSSANQRFLVVWDDLRDAGSTDIYGQLVNADGTLNGSNIPISTAPNGQSDPAIAYDSVNQRFLVVWSDARRSTGRDIYGQLVNADGALIGPDFAVPNTNNYYYINPAIAYDSANQRFLVVFSSYSSIDIDYDIYGQLINANGAITGSIFAISEAVTDQMYPHVAYDIANQRFLVVWEGFQTFSIYGQYVNANGTLSGSNFVINNDANRQRSPKVAYNSNYANLLVAFVTQISGEIPITDI